MMKPMMDQDIPFHSNTLYQNAGLRNLRALPRSNNNYFRWVLGRCKGREDDPGRYGINPVNLHPSAAQVPDDYATQMVQLLQAGVDVAVKNHTGKHQKK